MNDADIKTVLVCTVVFTACAVAIILALAGLMVGIGFAGFGVGFLVLALKKK